MNIKKSTYAIKGINKETQASCFLGIDHHSGGYEYWSMDTNFIPELFSREAALEQVKSIKKDFQKESGYLYNKHIDINSICLLEIGVIKEISIQKIEDITKETLIDSIKNKLSGEELAFIRDTKFNF